MTKIKKVLGYAAAWMSVPLVMATLMGMNFWAQQLASVSGVKVSPWFTGGDVARIISHNSYQTIIHRPVFDGLFWEKKEGFVQINWLPIQALPPKWIEEIDANGDGKPDFTVFLDSKSLETRLLSRDNSVIGLGETLRLKDSIAVRVRLRNSSR